MNDRRTTICLITPGHLSTNPRLVKEADALSAAGYDVTVIAATYQPWAMQADANFASRPWRIVTPKPFGPHAPAGLRAWQAVRQRSARWIVRCAAGHSAVVRTACHPVAPDLARAASASPADLYIAHYTAALPAAALAAKRHGALYAFDAEDFHTGEVVPGARGDGERRMIAAIEAAYLPGCAYVTAASPGIADAYAEAVGIARPAVVLNVFPRDQAPSRATARGAAAPGPSVYWFSQTLGPDRGLETAVRAIGQAGVRPHLYLRGTPSNGYAERLEALAGEVGAADQLHLLPPAPPEEMVRLAADYDVGLVGETGHTLNRRIALTNKQFTYLLAGVPVLMSDIEAHRRVAPEGEGALFLYRAEDPSSLAGALDALLTCPTTLAAARSAALRLGQERFTWDVEKSVFLGQVEQALESGRRH